ncbi:hypothetical protein ACIGXM_29850 [Kitasatospora sp. NPDC052896]|uniref:hypothetical protein n=1 Tax=Kitasatospora sp. NPDC052896 TaxID=3364061 RepID=UPI0037CB0AF0
MNARSRRLGGRILRAVVLWRNHNAAFVCSAEWSGAVDGWSDAFPALKRARFLGKWACPWNLRRQLS